MSHNAITPEQAYRHCKPEDLGFTTTDDVKDLVRFLGQERALEAVDFGIGIQHKGFNLFVIGPHGTGRHGVIQSFINEKAEKESAPADWCYVQNFRDNHKPYALRFPSGKSLIFKKEIHDLVDMLKTTIPAVFEGEDYRARSNALKNTTNLKIEKLYNEVESQAKNDNIAVVKNEQGILFTTIDDEGKPLDTKSFLQLPGKNRKKIEKLIKKYQGKLQQVINKVSIIKREREELHRKLKQKTAKLAVTYMIHTLQTKYDGQDHIVQYLQELEEEITEKVDDFLHRPATERDKILSLSSRQSTSFEQYEVNVLVTNGSEGAPVVYEDMPTYQNMHGRIEHKAKMGVFSTHFTLIKPGSLHRANGGYLIIDARRLLIQPYAYEGLKRTLRSGVIRIEPVEQLLGLMSMVSLEPEPIPLDVKVVLVGAPYIYYLLNHYDPEFQSLFKVQADFEHTMDRNEKSQKLYGALLANLVKDKDLLPLHRTAVARIIEQASRMAGDNDKLSLQIEKNFDLIHEADYFARKKGKDCVELSEIEEALAACKRRSSRLRDRVFETIVKGIRHIETTGSIVGQINGLSIVSLGDNSFGMPTRITAMTRPGKGKIIDIEREVELGGPIHSKGVMILDSFLSSRYARKIPLGFKGSLVFEQSYGGVDGDSASCAELCALLSSLANAPIRQTLAITGSISQKGEVQAIGGVNEKIECFFDICRQRECSGEEGVIIPKTNVGHLMLKKEVVDAIREKTFTVYFVSHVDEAIELLTSSDAGELDVDGNYPEGSINGCIEATLLRFATDIQKFERENSNKAEEH